MSGKTADISVQTVLPVVTANSTLVVNSIKQETAVMTALLGIRCIERLGHLGIEL